ncbi:hypothetical protein SLI_0313 [Streptomyces lividans 1326]|uniref:Uncharacterized protein n=1 Tax=Streptomyces lividans 1326 TaxID=1200984 RepID=A0A7U9DLA1_STRLI|nr:hypothetical protein SLI_0313 [Streptomyces lividans 1326]
MRAGEGVQHRPRHRTVQLPVPLGVFRAQPDHGRHPAGCAGCGHGRSLLREAGRFRAGDGPGADGHGPVSP